MAVQTIFTIAIAVASVFVIPGVAGLVKLIRQGDAQAAATRELATAVNSLAKAVDELHGDHKELRSQHQSVADRVTRLEATRPARA
jgi:outer membrane murein-binding lipoprotein Lpp